MKTKEEIKAQITKEVENHSRKQLIDMLAEMTHTLHDLQDACCFYFLYSSSGLFALSKNNMHRLNDDIRHMKTILKALGCHPAD